jgi:hypothetical protein
LKFAQQLFVFKKQKIKENRNMPNITENFFFLIKSFNCKNIILPYFIKENKENDKPLLND